MKRVFPLAALVIAIGLLAGNCSRASNGREGGEPKSGGDAPAEAHAVSVKGVVERSVPVGDRVRVSGRCLGYTAGPAIGGPPVTRSDWQLEDGGVAVYVTGALPDGCSATGGGASPVAITAVVAEDSVEIGAGRTRTARRYLIRVD
jgi:hypothetical protein